MRRVNEAVREVLSARIAEGFSDPRIGFVTLTSVETSPDLRHARVYVSVLGDETERDDTLAGLASAHGLLQQVIAELRAADKLLLTTHENPDGDALGSLLAMQWILEQLGKDSLMYMSPDEFPLPWEYRAWTFDKRLVGAPPDDVAERTIVFLDCGNIDRMPVDFLQVEGLHILNIDHHHDNTRFDTVRFMYENTSPTAHRMAAELIEAGVEPHQVYRRLFENLPFRRVQLLQRALSSVERLDGGVITVAHLEKDDYAETGAFETDSEGVVDHMRAVEGTAVAVLVRDLLSEDRNGLRKVSLRATDGSVDVSRIAREFGGGGHPP